MSARPEKEKPAGGDAAGFKAFSTKENHQMQTQHITRSQCGKVKFRRRAGRIDFAAINRAALIALPALCARWLPDGRPIAGRWVARNPKRLDNSPGSFSINLRTGVWKDFASDDKGGDPISLAAWLFDLSQGEAAKRLAAALGLDGEGR